MLGEISFSSHRRSLVHDSHSSKTTENRKSKLIPLFKIFLKLVPLVNEVRGQQHEKIQPHEWMHNRPTVKNLQMSIVFQNIRLFRYRWHTTYGPSGPIYLTGSAVHYNRCKLPKNLPLAPLLEQRSVVFSDKCAYRQAGPAFLSVSSIPPPGPHR